jgi:cell division protease FtsH
VEMDGFESNEGVILVAATNRPDVLDPALLRPGRFDRRIVVPRPDLNGRLGILKVHTKKTPLEQTVDLVQIARGTPGFSGADIENLVNEAALYAARRNRERLGTDDFEFAKDKVLMGTERRSMFISEKEKRITAIHEGGHALVARIIPGTDPVHKVTIIPRGRALGLTQQLPQEDRLNVSQEFALNQVAILMGGRIAEEITFGQRTTGAGNDIEVATNLARSMVCEWGMSEKMGPLAFGKKEGEVFLGREMGAMQTYSEQTARDIDAEVHRIVTEQYERAKAILTEHQATLHRIADALMEYETLDTADIDVLLGGGNIARPPPVKSNVAPQGERKKLGLLDAAGAVPAPGKA